MQSNSSMEYRLLGPTGLKVSIVGLGTNNFNDLANQQFANDVIKKSFDLGINFFDTAETYGKGISEIMLGKAIKANNIKREDVVVITKLFWGSVGGVNAVGLSRKRIMEGIKNSLKALDMAYVDIVFAHRYDTETPLEEVCRAFHSVIEKGQALYWGTSEWSALQIGSAIKLCTQSGLHKPVVEQPQYNMIHRERFEVEYVPLYDEYKYGTTIWSPLGAGLLTGKYVKDLNAPGKLQKLPQDFKDLVGWSKYLAPEKIEGTKKMFEALEQIAKELEALHNLRWHGLSEIRMFVQRLWRYPRWNRLRIM